MDRPALDDALTDRDAVLRAFVKPDGGLAAIPTKIRKRLVVLNEMAQQFEIGRTYDEISVNTLLRAWHDDVAALRRYLVEEGFLERRDRVYWRAGGTGRGIGACARGPGWAPARSRFGMGRPRARGSRSGAATLCSC